METWLVAIKEPISAMAVKIWGYIPNVVAAVLILIIGLVACKIIASIIVRALKLSKLDVLSEKSGLANILRQGDIKATIGEIVETVIYWLLVLLVAVTAAQALKFTAAVAISEKIMAYIPNVIAAILVLAIGIFAASFVGSLVSASAKNAGLKKANLLTQIVRVAIMIFVIGMALEQLQIAAALVTQTLTVVILSVGAGFALAFGLGCKDLVGKWVSDFVNSF